MIHDIVLRELAADLGITVSFIGHDVAFAVNVLADDGDDVLFRRVIHMKRAGASVPFNECQDGVLVPSALLDLETVFATDIGFVNLDDTASVPLATKRRRALPHGCGVP